MELKAIPLLFCNREAQYGRYAHSTMHNVFLCVLVHEISMQPPRKLLLLEPRYARFNYPIDVRPIEISFDYGLVGNGYSVLQDLKGSAVFLINPSREAIQTNSVDYFVFRLLIALSRIPRGLPSMAGTVIPESRKSWAGSLLNFSFTLYGSALM